MSERIAETMAAAAPLDPVGTNQHSPGGGAVAFPRHGSNSAVYLAARIKRDAPEIAAAVERGEFKTMRAAAIAAGIVNARTALDKLRSDWKQATAAGARGLSEGGHRVGGSTTEPLAPLPHARLLMARSSAQQGGRDDKGI